ncbi:MAG: haloacid dehalogenase-like hydrolase, partial [Chloroflexota bacterium]|nr:haloacid dehalogenase-like hydrolase [Chloroflexota bacterium]
KLLRIETLACDLFIDDLPEFLSEPDFPAGVTRVLFDPNRQHLDESRFKRVSSWQEISQLIGAWRAAA